MQKSFFFICPTDCLEHTINRRYRNENYFYTSLGNSFSNDTITIESISRTIKKHKINTIYFVLSTDNKIVLEALDGNEFSNISILNNFYNDITIQKEHSKIAFRESDYQFAVLSYYLNKKIKELEWQLMNLLGTSIKIRGKIYNRNQGVFTTIYSDLICIKKYHLN